MRSIGLLLILLQSINVANALQVSVPLEHVAIHPQRSASATALSLNNATISSQLQAKVETIRVHVSEEVKQGDLLVKLDCSDYQLTQRMAQAKVRASQARLVVAQSQRQRTEQLLAKQLTSQDIADRAIAEAITREAELEENLVGQKRAELDVSRCAIKAPFDGIITARNIAEGQLAAVGSSLLTIVETKRIELAAKINPEDIPLLQQVKQLLFDFGEQVPVKILYLGGVVDSATRNQEVRFTFSGKKPLPGTAGKLIWRDPRLFIPPQYIVKRGQDFGVFIERNGVAEFVVIPNTTPGRANPIALPLDTLIVTEGLGLLQSGDAL